MYVQGYTEVRYDEERKRVVYEPLQLTQAFRCVSFLNSPYFIVANVYAPATLTLHLPGNKLAKVSALIGRRSSSPFLHLPHRPLSRKSNRQEYILLLSGNIYISYPTAKGVTLVLGTDQTKSSTKQIAQSEVCG